MHALLILLFAVEAVHIMSVLLSPLGMQNWLCLFQRPWSVVWFWLKLIKGFDWIRTNGDNIKTLMNRWVGGG
jgi:hypothetical protein